jgi:hypothetical protein
MAVRTREWQLAARPHGEPTPGDSRLVEHDHPHPAEGQVVIRSIAMSVDPYMRGRMRDTPSYAPPWQVGETTNGGAVGRVVRETVRDGLEQAVPTFIDLLRGGQHREDRSSGWRRIRTDRAQTSPPTWTRSRWVTSKISAAEITETGEPTPMPFSVTNPGGKNRICASTAGRFAAMAVRVRTEAR